MVLIKQYWWRNWWVHLSSQQILSQRNLLLIMWNWGATFKIVCNLDKFSILFRIWIICKFNRFAKLRIRFEKIQFGKVYSGKYNHESWWSKVVNGGFRKFITSFVLPSPETPTEWNFFLLHFLLQTSSGSDTLGRF